jgi:hypothetical protein
VTPTAETLRDLYPDGRVLFYEGDDPAGFIAEMKEQFGLDVCCSLFVPAEHIDAIESGRWGPSTMASGRRWPLGS